MQRNRYVYMCVCETKRERDCERHKTENTQEDVYINKEKKSTFYKVGVGCFI